MRSTRWILLSIAVVMSLPAAAPVAHGQQRSKPRVERTRAAPTKARAPRARVPARKVRVDRRRAARHLRKSGALLSRRLERAKRTGRFRFRTVLPALDDDAGAARLRVQRGTVASIEMNRGRGRIRFSKPVEISGLVPPRLTASARQRLGKPAAWMIDGAGKMAGHVGVAVQSVDVAMRGDKVVLTPRVKLFIPGAALRDLQLALGPELQLPVTVGGGEPQPGQTSVDARANLRVQWDAGKVPLGHGMALAHDEPTVTELDVQASGDPAQTIDFSVDLRNAGGRKTRIIDPAAPLVAARGPSRAPRWLQRLDAGARQRISVKLGGIRARGRVNGRTGTTEILLRDSLTGWARGLVDRVPGLAGRELAVALPPGGGGGVDGVAEVLLALGQSLERGAPVRGADGGVQFQVASGGMVWRGRVSVGATPAGQGIELSYEAHLDGEVR